MATRLGSALLDIADKKPEHAPRINRAVADLDRTITVTGRKGAGIKMLGAWRTCMETYKTVTGRDWRAK